LTFPGLENKLTSLASVACLSSNITEVISPFKKEKKGAYMESMFLIGIAVFALVAASLLYKAKTKKALNHLRRHVGKPHAIPTAIGIFVIAGHLSEMIYTIEHVSIPEITMALGVFALWMVTKSGAEEIL
jgi:UDP-N-acetylmuramyl pentapeptide phosphotransferase/UDP-N-acetylglucosamine-1-phosphate transferase